MRNITVYNLINLTKKNPPKRVLYGERVWKFIETNQDYKSGGEFLFPELISKCGSWLDNEVEIIEE